MTVQLANGTAVTKAGLDKTAFVADDQLFTVNTTVYEVTLIPGSTTKTRRRKLWNAGQVVRQSDIDRAWPTATITSLSPTSGPAAGGTAVTITGTNLRGVTAATFGGTAATSVVAVNETTVTCVTPAKTAATYDVAVTDDSGTATKTAAFTYV
jgi:hypothetical protein